MRSYKSYQFAEACWYVEAGKKPESWLLYVCGLCPMRIGPTSTRWLGDCLHKMHYRRGRPSLHDPRQFLYRDWSGACGLVHSLKYRVSVSTIIARDLADNVCAAACTLDVSNVHTYIRSVSVLQDIPIVGAIRCDDPGILCVSLGSSWVRDHL